MNYGLGNISVSTSTYLGTVGRGHNGYHTGGWGDTRGGGMRLVYRCVRRIEGNNDNVGGGE